MSLLSEYPAPPSSATTQRFFPGFESRMIQTKDVMIRTLVAGSGPVILLLHGHPQTHVTWHKVAARLSKNFTVVLTDLRGYGDSEKPEGGTRSVNYSPRAMAADQVEVMRALGFDQFMVAGHDRGGRVAHRMALDFPECITRIAVLDIAPTLTMYERTNQEFATRYVWWFFQIQPYPGPERMIGLDAEGYLRHHLQNQCKTPGAVTEDAMKEYLRCYLATKTIHALCEDYRAAAGVGLEQDAEDDRAGKKIRAPLLALWGSKGVVGQLYDVLATWREKAAKVSGRALECGHLIPEEMPDETYIELNKFFS